MKKLALLSVIIIFTFQNNYAVNYTVAKNGGDFLTIDDALKGARDGDTINVMPGFYEEPMLTIDKKITLIGSGFQCTKILNKSDNFAISLTGGGTIKWFDISSNQSGLNLYNGTIINCIISNCKNDGIYISLEEYYTKQVQNCIVTQNQKGINISTGYSPNPQSLVIINTIAYKNQFGFVADSKFDLTYCASFQNSDDGKHNNNYDQNINPSTGTIVPKLITDTPKFIDDINFKLASDSPLKNSGSPLSKDPDGTNSDMGYYGGIYAPTFPVVKDAQIILENGKVKIKAIGVSAY